MTFMKLVGTGAVMGFGIGLIVVGATIPGVVVCGCSVLYALLRRS